MKREKVISKIPERFCIRDFLEAPPRLELGVKVLQTSDLPLGYGAVFDFAAVRITISYAKTLPFDTDAGLSRFTVRLPAK